MSNGFNKKMAELLGKMDDKVLQAKINAAMDMLKEGNTEEIKKKHAVPPHAAEAPHQ